MANKEQIGACEPQVIQEPKLSKQCHQNNQGLMSVVLHAAFAALHTVAKNAVYWFLPKRLCSSSKSICNLNIW